MAIKLSDRVTFLRSDTREAAMSEDMLKKLAEKLQMTPTAFRDHIIRSAYANARMENPNITIEMVKEAAAAGHVRV